MTEPNYKRQRRSFCDLQPELLELVSLNLSGPDLARFKSVCTSWRKAAERQQFRGPFLLLPAREESSLSNQPPTLQLMRGGTEVSYTLEKKTAEKLLNGGVCVGSSHEWLFFVDNYYYFRLLNIFSCKEIQLPGDVFPGFVDIEYEIIFNYGRIPIEKAILSASPSYDKNFKAVIIYGPKNKLWYCGGQGGRNEWTPLCNDGRYMDAVWEGDNLYALTEGQIVVTFDFKKSKPEKRTVFSPSYFERVKVIEFDAIQYYLVVSKGDILMIQRFIGDRVNGDGEMADESDLLPEGDDEGNNHPRVCPYRTLEFMVFKMDLERGTWRKMESLEDDQSIVLGGNQTMALSVKDYPGIKKNSIYFSDNYWERMREDYLYGGHDNGVFNLETGTVEMFVDSDSFDPTPFWITIL